MRLGKNHHMKLQISGNGTVNYNSHIDKMRDKMPESSKFVASYDSIMTSKDHIVFNPITTFCVVEHLFFLQNISSCLFEYQWYR